MSAEAATVAEVLELLLAGLLSGVVVETVAVLVMVEPPASLELACTTNRKVAKPPAARVASVAVNVPEPPAGGLDSTKAGPAVWLAETNVVPAGTASVSVTPWASLGPLLVT